MPSTLAGWLTAQARRKLSLLSTAARITFRPSAFADEARAHTGSRLLPAFKFFLGCVGIVLAIEAVFSLAFDTSFSDLVHQSFPIVVALLGGVAVYVFLKLLLTPNVRFVGTLSTTLYVGGAALLFMISVIFALLTADFLASYQDIEASPCSYRTIICLVSGGALAEYGVPRRGSGTLGMSIPFILLVMLGALVHYSRVLAKALRASMGVAFWRTYVAAAVSLVLLSPASLLAINVVYRMLYSQPWLASPSPGAGVS
ncbi:MAG: hypothetical protein KJZ80_16770 [Hyphomicrobiaceae bacterium]|nr:hypothetical protein [Hyphomicrobiaceae bacterium]